MSETEFGTKPPVGARVPNNRRATLLGGVALFSAAYLAFYFSVQKHQESKERKDKVEGGKVPTLESRLQQAQAPPEEPSSNSATLRTPETGGTRPS